jgi:hypothetical protein
LKVLQAIDCSRAYQELGYPSLFQYAVSGLKLSEGSAYNFITVARKAAQIPELQREITEGSLSVSKARKIVPVLTPENQFDWIARAKSLPQRVLEREVARVAPRTATPEKVTYVTESRFNLNLGVEETLMQGLQRVQDLESQRTHSAVTLVAALQAMVALYLERNDPVLSRERRSGTLPGTQPVARQAVNFPVLQRQARSPISAATRHRITLRDGARCTQVEPDGNRCAQRRWLDIHHVNPLSEGGTDALENLVTLCSAHHRQRHVVYDKTGS